MNWAGILAVITCHRFGYSQRIDNRNCGRWARSLAAEAFEFHDVRPMRDHDEVAKHWREFPGWIDGYMEGTKC